MARASLTIRGLREVRRSLQRLAKDAPKLAAPPLARALGPVLSHAQGEAPTGATGQLAAGLAIDGPSVKGSRASASVSTHGADYAGHVDLGTKRFEADDFITRTFDATASRAADSAANGILDAITGGF